MRFFPRKAAKIIAMNVITAMRKIVFDNLVCRTILVNIKLDNSKIYDFLHEWIV